MLLRHITEQVRSQNWFAVGIELVILVLGVFIGIQVANWNEARVGRQQLDQQYYADALTQRDTVLNPFMMKSIGYGALLEESYILGEHISDSNFRNDIAALAVSREFDNHLAYRYGISGSTVYALDSLSRATDRLIELLKKDEGQT